MKRRNWLWFVASALLAVLAGVLAMVVIRGQQDEQPIEEKQQVVVARNPIAINDVIRIDNVTLAERAEFPSGVAVAPADVEGCVALRNIAQGEAILMQDVYCASEPGEDILEDKVAIALPAEDILSKWGAVLPGEHVDVLVTMDVILETPMYPQDLRTVEDLELYAIERDQSMDDVSVLTLQNLEVIRIIEEPAPEGEQDPENPVPRNRALVLKADPQDAVVLKYLLDAVGTVTVVKRSVENEALFNVQPVNINYLMLRYGVVLPQPLE
ncbi:MAG: Flp pilus assembly protein CpaB [Anaerolineae bacterium]|nr:Flp pilus assembly protein CpaB [Anaerolineae bacterium]